jgi:hypothetical protein
MTILISPDVRLVIATADTTVFDYGTNEATELGITKEITLDRVMNSMAARAERVTSTPNRVGPYINTGFSGVTLKFSTYLKPLTDGGNVVSAEKLLWESLSATDTVDTATESTIGFTSGNTNKLRELFFYLILEDGTYYKVENAVVHTVNIAVDIKGITKATWDILALDMNYIAVDNLTGTPKDYTTKTFVRNKLSTLTLGIGATNYDLALIKGNITINNNVKLINRLRVGEILIPTGHYVSDRYSFAELTFYLNTKADGSSTLLADLLAYTTLAGINTLSNATLSLGGASNALRVDIQMPTSKLNLKNTGVGILSTMEITLIPQESSPGAADELSLVYNN